MKQEVTSLSGGESWTFLDSIINDTNRAKYVTLPSHWNEVIVYMSTSNSMTSVVHFTPDVYDQPSVGGSGAEKQIHVIGTGYYQNSNDNLRSAMFVYPNQNKIRIAVFSADGASVLSNSTVKIYYR